MTESNDEKLKVPEGFCGLVYAPSYEQEVVALFFLLLQHMERRFVVEEVRQDFPDCSLWEFTAAGTRTCKRVEFEIQSGDFAAHGHDPANCDLIVCWEHNWRQCPIEVVELRSEWQRLSDPHRFLLYPDQQRRPPQAWAIEDYTRACVEDAKLPRADDGIPFEVHLVRHLADMAARFSSFAQFRGGERNKRPGYTFRVCDSWTAMGADAPGKVYADFDAGSGAPEYLSKEMKGYRQSLYGKGVFKRPPPQGDLERTHLRHLHVDSQSHLDDLCEAVRELLTAVHNFLRR